MKKAVFLFSLLFVPLFFAGAQPFPVGDDVTFTADIPGNQRNSGAGVNKDGVIFIAFESTGKTAADREQWDIMAAISSNWTDWKIIEVCSRDSEDRDPKVAADPVTGNFAVTWWQDDNPGADIEADGDGLGEFFRIFKADGTPVTDVISVSDDKTPRGAGGQGWGSCAYNPANGNLYVINEDWGGGSSNVPSPDGDGDSQVLRAFDGSTGALVKGPIIVNTSWAGDQDDGFIGFTEDGSFVAAWRDLNIDLIYMQRFDKDFNKLGDEVDVTLDSEILVTVQNPNIAVAPDGRYVVSYEETQDMIDGDGRGVFISIFDKDGNSIARDIQVNQNYVGDQRDSEVSMDDQGRIVVVWEDYSPIDGDGRAAMCRAFSPDGEPLGPEVIVNTVTAGIQDNPSVYIGPSALASQAGFNFVVSYDDESGNDGDGRGVYARRFLLEETRIQEWMLME